MTIEPDPWENFDSGPYCRHWDDPDNCDIRCKTCGHRCPGHGFADDPGCHWYNESCNCKGWVEPDD